jgi:hypothetical protein
VREAFTIKGDEGQGIVEQIDGAVEIDGGLYLIEMKWWANAIGRQEIAPHLVSVYKGGDVGGIFVSYSGFSPAAIEDAKMGLTQKIFVLAELQEIVQVIDREGDLKTFSVPSVSWCSRRIHAPERLLVQEASGRNSRRVSRWLGLTGVSRKD